MFRDRTNAAYATTYTCWLSSGRVRKLGSNERDSGIDRIVLSGRFVAFEEYLCDRGEECTTVVSVRDVRSGRLRWKPFASGGGASDIVLRATGAIAFMYAAPGETRLEVVDRHGPRTLTHGADISAYSLAANGRRLYWLQAGEPHTALFD